MEQSRVLIIAMLGLFSCNVNTAERSYILAEKLWTAGNYGPSVAEFERVIDRAPKTKWGLQARFRAGVTQTLFLGQHEEAVQKFREYTSLAGFSRNAWEAQIQVGEVLFSRLERYREASAHYLQMLEKSTRYRPALTVSEAEWRDTLAFLLLRVARSYFFLWNFNDAVKTLDQIVENYPDSKWAERALFEKGLSLFTGGEQQPSNKRGSVSLYEKAIRVYEAFLQKYPQSGYAPEARFGIAMCLEELDRLPEAYDRYLELRGQFPSRDVIEVKIRRLGERIRARNQ